MMQPVALNGAPKMGNHALWKTCELLGIVTSGVNHIEMERPRQPMAEREAMAVRVAAYDAQPESTAVEGKCIFIKRDPRNALVSWVRFEGMPVTQGTLISAMASYLPQLPLYEGWLTDPDTLVVTFERLVADDQQMREIAAFAGVPYLDDAWPNLPNHTKTWTGRLSDYREHWTPAVDAAWVAAGGPALLERWGY